MNVVKEIQRINEKELELGIAGKEASWHAEWKHSAYVYIANLDFGLTEGDVRCVLEQFGKIIDVKLIRDHETGKSRGYGFACFEDQRSTNLAVDNLNGFQLLGRTLRCDHTNYKPESAPKNLDKESEERKKEREKKRKKQEEKEKKRLEKEEKRRKKELEKMKKEAIKFEEMIKKRKVEYQEWKEEQSEKERILQEQEKRKLEEWMERNKVSGQVGFKAYDPTKPGTAEEQLEELKKKGSFFGLQEEAKISGVPNFDVRDEELDKGILPDYPTLTKSKEKSFLQKQRDKRAKLRTILYKKSKKEGKVDTELGEKPRMDISEIQKKIGNSDFNAPWQ